MTFGQVNVCIEMQHVTKGLEVQARQHEADICQHTEYNHA